MLFCNASRVVHPGTVDFYSEITISSSFIAEASKTPSVDWNVLKLSALGDLRGDKSQGF